MKPKRKAGRLRQGTPAPSDLHSIVESLLGPVDWQPGQPYGFCKCPGYQKHTTHNGDQDCKVHLEDGAPNIHCFHNSCREEVTHFNARLQSEIGKAQWRHDHPLQRRPLPAATTSPPTTNQDPTLQFLQTCFAPDEAVSIAGSRDLPDGEVPIDAGVNRFTQAELVAMGTSSIERLYDQPYGFYVRINPVKKGCIKGKDEHITAFRHTLLESDTIPKAQQEEILRNSGLPISALIDSGGKSVHAWVRVDAQDIAQYHERRQKVWDSLPEEYQVDQANKNPSRFSRLPGMSRGGREQKLLALNIGPQSYQEWEDSQKYGGESAPVRLFDLLNYDTRADPKNLLGRRWLCQGMTAAWVAPTGIGKSTLMSQAMMSWGLEGRDFFGIKAVRPLNSYVIQRENDMGDMAEQVQGISKGLGLSKVEQGYLNDRLLFHRVTRHMGHQFGAFLEDTIHTHKPDIVWIDPLQNYIGDDLMDNRVVLEWLAGMVCSIAEKTDTLIILVHHTAKPPKDPKTLNNLTATDLAYLGKGASAIADSVREVVTLNRLRVGTDSPPTFRLDLCKRRKRARMRNHQGQITAHNFLRHATQGICWELTVLPSLSK